MLAYLVEFLNSILCVKKAVIVPREESIVYYIAKSLQVEFLGGLVVVVWFCCGFWLVGWLVLYQGTLSNYPKCFARSKIHSVTHQGASRWLKRPDMNVT